MNTSILRSRIKLVLIPVLVSFLFHSCEENPVVEEEHADPVGLVVSSGGVELVRIEGANVTGEFEVTEGVLSPHFKLQFIDKDGDLFVPTDADSSPEAIVGDPTVLEVVRDEPGDWDFHLRGLKEGTTTIKLAIKHGDHNDYESPEITVVIKHEDDNHGNEEAQGLVLKSEDGTVLAKIYGGLLQEGNGISVAQGNETDHITIWFLTDDENEFQPDEEHMIVEFDLENDAIAEIEQHEGEKWEFEVHGKAPGSTTLTVTLKHYDDVEFGASGIPVQVTP
ncbi:MAG: hypothetical protein J4G05_01245 [Chlorobi bacterium]|nr:hypothetical protein [Chlorobiota bacterium]